MMVMMTAAASGAATAGRTAGSAATCDATRGTTPQQFARPNATRSSGHIDIRTGTGAAHFYATVTSAARTGHRSTAANYTTTANITINTTITTRSITITFIDTFVAAVSVTVIH